VKKALIVVGVLGVLAVMILASLNKGDEGTGKKVYAQKLERRAISRIVKASGEIDARVRVNLSAHVVAKIEKLYVEEGDEIRAGERFLELEKEAFLASRDQWQAQLRQAQTAVRQAEVDLADARLKLERAERLRRDGVVSQQDLEAAQLRLRSAELDVESRGEAVRQAQASLDKALDDLGKTTLYAPITGRVTELNAEAGEVVVSGTMNNSASKIATIADLSEILAEISVDENDIVDVAIGQAVTLRVDAVADQEYHGRVVEVGSSGFSRANQPDVTFFRVKVLLADADVVLRPGMSVRAEIETASRENALVVPIEAVVERKPEGAEEGSEEGPQRIKVVYVVEGKKAVQRTVTIGLSDVTRVEILTGLEDGALIVTGPFRILRDLADGDAVRVGSEKDDRAKAKKKDKDEDDESSDSK
jgi:HlyD family secretion protein